MRKCKLKKKALRSVINRKSKQLHKAKKAKRVASQKNLASQGKKCSLCGVTAKDNHSSFKNYF